MTVIAQRVVGAGLGPDPSPTDAAAYLGAFEVVL